MRNIRTLLTEMKYKCLIDTWKRGISNFNSPLKKSEINILGIETSCDDTGVAVVSGCGRILGEGYYSQSGKSVKFGGVIPSVAKKYHKENIVKAVKDAFEESKLSPSQITAVAATVKPGNTGTLAVGAEFGKELALSHGLPFIPIHHMEAHALTVRMEHQVNFPFLVLLVSGGHCVLAVAHALDEWSIVGETIDLSPGNLLDHLSRRMKLKNLPATSQMAGGKAIETLARDGDPKRFMCPSPMSHYRDSNFSFSAFHSYITSLIIRLEEQSGVEGGRVLDEVSDICASLQYSVVKHLIRQTHKGIRFLDASNRIPMQTKTLVISGGVASNLFLREAFEKLCESEGYRLLVPPAKLCTDNGIMVAWNGVERWKASKGVLYDRTDLTAVQVRNKCPLGPSITNEQRELNLQNPKWVKI